MKLNLTTKDKSHILFKQGKLHVVKDHQTILLCYSLENGMITNSLAPFYVKWYRYSIPENDMNKLEQLKQFYNGKA